MRSRINPPEQGYFSTFAGSLHRFVRLHCIILRFVAPGKRACVLVFSGERAEAPRKAKDLSPESVKESSSLQETGLVVR